MVLTAQPCSWHGHVSGALQTAYAGMQSVKRVLDAAVGRKRVELLMLLVMLVEQSASQITRDCC